MIKKTKDYMELIASKVKSALDYNEELEKNPKEGYTPIKLTDIEISRGLYNYFIKNGIPADFICNKLGITYGIGVTEISIYDNGDYCHMYVRY